MNVIENENFVGTLDSTLVELQLRIMLAMGVAITTNSMPLLRTQYSIARYSRYFHSVGAEGVECEIRTKMKRANTGVVIVPNKFPYDIFDTIRNGRVLHECLWWDQTNIEMTSLKMKEQFLYRYGAGASIYTYENIELYKSVPALHHKQVFVVGSKRRV